MPTVCKIQLDAAEYRAELNKIVEETRAASAVLAAPVDRTVTAKAGAKSVAAVTDDLKTAAAIPATADTRKAEQSVDELGKSIEQVGEKATRVGKSVEQTAKKVSNGAQDAESSCAKWIRIFGFGGSVVEIFKKGIEGAIKAVVSYYERYMETLAAAAALSGRNADSVQETAAAYTAAAEKADGYLSRLSELANAEKMSNVQKAESVSLIAQLGKNYKDLGITLDATTGKLRGVDAAILKKQKTDLSQRQKAIQAEILERTNAADLEGERRDEAGFSSAWLLGIPNLLTWNSKTRVGGKQDANDAQQKQEDHRKRIRELMAELAELKKINLEEDFLRKRRAENADVAKGIEARERTFSEQQSDDAFSDAKTVEEKVAERRVRLDELQSRRIQPLRGKVAAAEQSYADAVVAGDEADRLEARRTLLQLQKELQADEEKSYSLSRQIKTLDLQRAEAVERIARQGAHELEYNRLIAAGEVDKAAALQLEKELKDQNLQLSEREKEAVLAQRRAISAQDGAKRIAEAREDVRLQELLVSGKYAEYEAAKLRLKVKREGKKLTEAESQALLDHQNQLAALNLRKNLQANAFSLYGQAMEQTGYGRMFAEEKALREAREAKGGALSPEEDAVVKRLSMLSQEISNTRETQYGDLVLKTNALTSRGGFSGGVKLPDAEKYNREIAQTGKQQLKTLTEIKQICDKLGVF